MVTALGVFKPGHQSDLYNLVYKRKKTYVLILNAVEENSALTVLGNRPDTVLTDKITGKTIT